MSELSRVLRVDNHMGWTNEKVSGIIFIATEIFIYSYAVEQWPTGNIFFS